MSPYFTCSFSLFPRSSKYQLLVEVGGVLSSYSITGGHQSTEDDDTAGESDPPSVDTDDIAAAIFAKNAEWIGTYNRRLVASTGVIETERSLLTPQTMKVELTAHTDDHGAVRAHTIFEKMSDEVVFQHEEPATDA